MFSITENVVPVKVYSTGLASFNINSLCFPVNFPVILTYPKRSATFTKRITNICWPDIQTDQFIHSAHVDHRRDTLIETGQVDHMDVISWLKQSGRSRGCAPTMVRSDSSLSHSSIVGAVPLWPLWRSSQMIKETFDLDWQYSDV